MRRIVGVALLLVVLVVAAGCASASAPAPGPRELSLSHPGSTLSVKVDTEGRVAITATIPAGFPGAGTYTSTNAGLQEDATNAKNAMNGPGEVFISVDGAGALVGFGTVFGR